MPRSNRGQTCPPEAQTLRLSGVWPDWARNRTETGLSGVERRQLTAIIGHSCFHGKEGVPSSNPGGGSTQNPVDARVLAVSWVFQILPKLCRGQTRGQTCQATAKEGPIARHPRDFAESPAHMCRCGRGRDRAVGRDAYAFSASWRPSGTTASRAWRERSIASRFMSTRISSN